VLPYIERYGIHDLVREHPVRVPYLDVLTHLRAATGNLILGSTEAHYTPSKAFQVVRAGKPVFALLHRASTAATLVEQARAGTLVTLTADALPRAADVTQALATYLRTLGMPQAPADLSQFAAFTSQHSAGLLARALDDALERRQRPAA
jgi:hypothetical protein